MQLTNVIIRPYLTEKAFSRRELESKQYAFVVNTKASKQMIKKAFIALFNIEPESISTMIRKPSSIRTGTMHPGFTSAFKIAYIVLPKGKDIVISKEEAEAKAKVSAKKETKEASVEVAKEVVKPAKQQEVKTEAKKTSWQKQTNKNH